MVSYAAAWIGLALGATTSPPPCAAPFPLDSKDPVLQQNLTTEMRSAGLDPALRKGQLAVALVDLTRPDRLAYAGHNDDSMLYAASLPKIGILLAVTQLVANGDVQWQPTFAYRLRKMITISNNHFASWAFDQATLPRIAEVLRLPRYCLYVPPDGGLWVGRAFRKGGPSRRDPLHNISHGATARQTARFYAMLDEGRLVSPYWSNRMLHLMAPPEYVHKFVAALRGRTGLRFLARKSGTWTTFHADSALIDHWGRKYVLVGLADRPDGEIVLRTVALIADNLIMKGEHRQQ